MDSRDLRATILKIQDYLNDNDRKRLHFFLGSDVPRRIRDDPSLAGTINLMESLFDQDKISERDVSLLIQAFEKIQCIDAVKILKDHMKQMKHTGQDQSITNLSTILLQDQEDKYALNMSMIQANNYQDNNIQINHNTTTTINDKYSMKLSSKKTIILLLLSVLLNLVLAIILSIYIKRIAESNKNPKPKNMISFTKTNAPMNVVLSSSTDREYCVETDKPLDILHKIVWIDAQDGYIPESAVIGGREDNREIYVARAYIKNNLIPGKLVAGNKSAEVEYYGFEKNSSYQILTSTDSELKFVWVPTCGSKLPSCALLAGREGAYNLYIGRTFHCSDAIVVGKFNDVYGPLFYVWKQDKIETNKNIQVLCVFDKKQFFENKC
ncbi:hypothetical protein I4U23_016848 [Adineta vaga]|nr:hypothetical protein I4U23_016848 [Adineta vaga]